MQCVSFPQWVRRFAPSRNECDSWDLPDGESRPDGRAKHRSAQAGRCARTVPRGGRAFRQRGVSSEVNRS
jgi:hypothetical protein